MPLDVSELKLHDTMRKLWCWYIWCVEALHNFVIMVSFYLSVGEGNVYCDPRFLSIFWISVAKSHIVCFPNWNPMGLQTDTDFAGAFCRMSDGKASYMGDASESMC